MQHGSIQIKLSTLNRTKERRKQFSTQQFIIQPQIEGTHHNTSDKTITYQNIHSNFSQLGEHRSYSTLVHHHPEYQKELSWHVLLQTQQCDNISLYDYPYHHKSNHQYWRDTSQSSSSHKKNKQAYHLENHHLSHSLSQKQQNHLHFDSSS